LSYIVGKIAFVTRIIRVDLIAEDIDPIEALLANVPEGTFSEFRRN
jgi:hypothetical protein